MVYDKEISNLIHIELGDLTFFHGDVSPKILNFCKTSDYPLPFSNLNSEKKKYLTQTVCVSYDLRRIPARIGLHTFGSKIAELHNTLNYSDSNKRSFYNSFNTSVLKDYIRSIVELCEDKKSPVYAHAIFNIMDTRYDVDFACIQCKSEDDDLLEYYLIYIDSKLAE